MILLYMNKRDIDQNCDNYIQEYRIVKLHYENLRENNRNKINEKGCVYQQKQFGSIARGWGVRL